MHLTDGQELQNIISKAPIGICILNAENFVAETLNEKFLEIAGKPREAILGKWYWEPFAEARQYFEEALTSVALTGDAYYANEMELMLIRHGREETVFVTFVYAPVKDSSGKITKVAVWVLENTLQVSEREKVIAAKLAMQAERDRLKSFFMQAPVGICVLNGPQLIYELVNPVYQQLLPDRVLTGRPIFEALPELVGTPVQQILLDVYSKGQPVELNELLIPVAEYEGGPTVDRYFSFSYQPRLDENGTVDGILAIVFEVTSFLKVQEQLRDAREQADQQKRIYETITSGTPDLMYVWDLNYRFTYVNSALLTMWGKTWHTAIGKGLRENGYEEWHAAMHEREIDHVIATKESVRGEVSFPHAVLGKRTYDYILIPVLNEQGQVEAVAGTTRDVSERKRLEEELAQAVEETQAINEELGATNEELAAANEEYTAINEELAATNDELMESEQRLNAALEDSARSERLFRSIALNIPRSLVIVIDHNYRFLAVEGDLMAKMGYDAKDYQGKFAHDVVPPERYTASKPLYDRVLSGETFSVERKAETGEDFMVHLVPLRNEQEEVYAGLIIALDVTEIKQAEEKSAKLAAIVESSEDAIISKTFDSVITSWNEAARRMFGYTADEMIGETIYKLIPEDRQEEEPEILARLRRGERVEHFETKRKTKDGRLLDVSLSISPVKDKQGNVIGLSKIARDITERKLDEARKGDFIGMVSHELKTPLTSLTAIVQVAEAKLRNSEDAFLAAGMQKASQQTKRMAVMINGFLNVSRLESGKIHIDRQEFDLETLIEEVMEETQLTLTTHIVRFEPCRPVMVVADREKIASVLANLMSNAAKYSPKGMEIDVKCELIENSARVSIRDEGMGISAEDIPHVFDRYYRVANTQTQHISGFGIGLYLSAEIINRHDGKIWAESKEGKGSTFYFSLPL